MRTKRRIMMMKLHLLALFLVLPAVAPQLQRKVSKFTEVYAWRQLTFDIDGVVLTQDRADNPSASGSRFKRQDQWNWSGGSRQTTTSTTTARTTSDSDEGRFFIQYNNVPMGAERVGNRLFISIPRRRYGIPATLNYIDLEKHQQDRSPPLTPYPNVRDSARLTSVYRTRADSCGRLWMVDTGRLELASLASITVDITNNACDDAYAYIPDLTTFGLIVYSLRENDSWRHRHNYYSFSPVAGNLFIADQSFQWSDGVFSVVLVPRADGCKTAFFHSLIGTHEFSVSTCVLKNRTAINDRNYFAEYSIVGDRGEMTQSTMHDYHPGSQVMFFAEIGRDAVSCWNTREVLRSTNVGVLARDRRKLSYPSDLHVTEDDVWVMVNTLPRFGYSRLDTNEYNFYVYRANVQDVISDTVCNSNSYPYRSGFGAEDGKEN